MKFFSALVLLLAAGLPPAAAQKGATLFTIEDEYAQRMFFGGLTLGANFSQVDGDALAGYHRVGLHVGPQVWVRIKGALFASVEILYAQKGSKDRSITDLGGAGPGVSGYDLKLNYAEVPVMLHYNYRRHFMFGLGASYARLISSDESAFAAYPVNIHADVSYFHKDDIDWLAEVGYEFWKGWLIGLRYQYSLRSIRDGNRIPVGYGGGIASGQFNNSFALRVNYFFHSKAKE